LQQRSHVRAEWLGRQRRYFNGFVIGREPNCELCVDDEQVSRRHAAVLLEEGRWWLQDLNSRNGTMVNGELIHRIELPEVANVVLYQDGPGLKLFLERDDDATRVAR
jgi:pSer/pThr/pTyr-binding forkhead associated (FHA) protein